MDLTSGAGPDLLDHLLSHTRPPEPLPQEAKRPISALMTRVSVTSVQRGGSVTSGYHEAIDMGSFPRSMIDLVQQLVLESEIQPICRPFSLGSSLG